METTNSYYPLAQNNKWKYLLKDGTYYTNTVTSFDAIANEFIMVNSLMNKNQIIKKENDSYLTDAFEEGTLNTLLKDIVSLGETWEIKFKANNFDNILVMIVKEIELTKEVNNMVFNNVIMIEAESKILMNDNIIPLNFFTQYYYAKGVGLILTTSSMGDSQSLVEYTLN